MIYNYFIKDHLGNTRVVLTEQTDFTHYIATMEPDKEAKEEALFYNLNSTRTPKPVDYPQDNTTSPNQAVAKLNGKDPDKRIGPSIILKVMAGDTIQAAVRAFYKKETTPKNKVVIPAEQMLAGLVQALVTPGMQAVTTHSNRLVPNARIRGSGLTANDLQQLKNKGPENKKTNKPKAYLNYVFFDKQLNFVEEGSGVRQVDGEAGKLETLSSGKVVAKENGYVYVFTSNESQEDVLFDNFGVMQVTGPVLEETHYYPFGLTMSRISTTAPLKLEGKRKFNGKELNHKEFSDGSGLEWYSYGMREYDAQIGRFFRVDPLATKYTYLTPYQYASNNPITNIDVDGLEGTPFTLTSPFISDLTIQQTLYERNISKGVSPQEAHTQSAYQLMGIKVAEAAAVVGAAYLVSESGIVGAARTLYGFFKGAKKLRSEKVAKRPSKLKPKEGSLGGPGSGKNFSEKVKNQVRTESDNTCVFCGRKTTKGENSPSKSNIDHAIPKVKKGNNTVENAQNTCRTCNLQKRTRTTEEFLKDIKNGEKLKSLDQN